MPSRADSTTKKNGALALVLVALTVVLAVLGYYAYRGTVDEQRNGSVAAAAALDTLLHDLGSGRSTLAVADSIDIARRSMSTRLPLRASPRVPVLLDPDSILERQTSTLRKDAQLRAATHAAAKSYVESLKKNIAVLAEEVEKSHADALGVIRSFAWPLTIVLLAILLLWNPQRFTALLGRIRSIRLLNSEVVLSEQTTRAAEDTFSELRTQATLRFRHLAAKKGIPQLFVDVMNQKVRPQLQNVLGTDTSLRGTLYVEDILFAKFLTQLVDYWPEGGGRGRAFPIYFGIIGKAWRLGRTVIRGDIPTDAERLILDWGMTEEEARAKGKNRQSFAAIVLKKGSRRVGILYLDCQPNNAFGEDDSPAGPTEFELAVVKECEAFGLVTALAELEEEARSDADPISLV